MGVGRCRERNSFLDREPDNLLARIKFVHGFAPSGGGELDRQISRADKIECFVYDYANIAARPVAVDLDEIEVRQAINEARAGNVANPPKIIFVDFVDVAPD